MPVYCKSCESEVNGNFCSSCGQYVISKRLTVRSIVVLTFRRLFDLENSFWSTIRMLILKPEKVVNGYLGGATKLYYNPVRFVFLAIAISLLVMTFFGLGETDITAFSIQDPEEFTDNQKEFQQIYFDLMMNLMNVISLFVIPFFALLTMLFYRKRKLYYAEHIALNSYGVGIATLLSLPITVIAGATNTMMTYGSLGSLLVTFLYYIFFVQRLWREGLPLSAIKSLLTVIFGYIFYVIVFAILSFVGIMIYLSLTQ